MALFQKVILKKHLNDLNQEQLQTAWKVFRSHFHNPAKQENIRNLKEEQYQEGFFRELFVDVLGYTINPIPNFNLTTEYKNEKDSKKADGAILRGEAVAAVIELKGTDTTDLSKIETQVFSYKNNQKGCTYVISSNFEKLRFYINDAVDHLEFNLFTLSEKDFAVLYCCLKADAILSDTPLKMKEASLAAEENVTKKLYADYSNFKRKLFHSIAGLNPQYDKLTLYKKTQKLLDRFLFMLFAEDRLLLPPNSVRKILQDWDKLKEMDFYQPLYEIFKKHFNYLNTGYEGKDFEIFAYNGGLFAADEILDNILVNDELLFDATKQLSQYDFESEVDVNILGHIFEHSLSEMEEMERQLSNAVISSEEGSAETLAAKTISKRKKDGVFYTPRYITKYIVENTIGTLCTAKKEELLITDDAFTPQKRKDNTKKLQQKLEEYRQWLLQLTICDPACGSGAFLNQALEFLINEHRYIDTLSAKLFGDAFVLSDVENSILENNLFGVDINEEAVEIARLSLWLRTARKGRKLNNLNNNIKCGNSLIDDKSVAGEKAFNWKSEFSQIFANNGFHIIIGNPPYVFSREKINNIDKAYYNKNYLSALYQVNTYLLFIEKSNQLLKQDGVCGLIVPNAWLMVSSAKKLREYLLSNTTIKEIVNLLGYSFENVNVETIILFLEKKIQGGNNVIIKQNNNQEFFYENTKQQDNFLKEEGFEFKVFTDGNSDSITNKIKTKSEVLEDVAIVKAGLQAYESGKGEPKQTPEDVIKRPYDYNFKFDDSTYKYLDGKDVGRYYFLWSSLYLKYGGHLAAPRTFDLFSGEKIIVREITGKFPKCLIATYNDEIYLFNRSNIGIVEKQGTGYNLKFILAIINSTLLSYYFLKNTPKSVRLMFPKIILQDLKKFPIKKCDSSAQIPFIEQCEIMLTKNKELQIAKQNFLSFTLSKFELLVVNRKLADWNLLTSKEFLKELEKQKIKLSLGEQSEWMTYFETEKAKANSIQQIISNTDKEIDRMVYELYELTEEEIKIVNE